MAQTLVYTGTIQPTSEEQKELKIFPYLPADTLRDAVNLAIYLERPLLIKGEPGSGKTRLAEAVAFEFGKRYNQATPTTAGEKDPLGWPFYFWSVKSTGRAQDGLYTFDAIGRLRDAQMKIKNKAIEDYIHYGPLGKAFARTDRRPIIMIDEIDKADIDFPNDLLLELDEQKFEVKELNKPVRAELKPIVFITSNDEKDLPDAFLRRCLFYYIDFPKKPQLLTIITNRFPDHDPQLVEKAVDHFLALRELLEAEKGRAGKKVSTSELIDWIKALHRNLNDAPLPDEVRARLAAKTADELRANFEQAEPADKLALDQVLNLLDGRLPFLGVLLKNWDDYTTYLSKLAASKARQEAGS
jgi:MoxR-like ATPase